jgi:cytochrome bd-type quinol oxidase subunit 2
MTLAEAPLLLMLVGLTIYAVLGGADFGAAFWQLGSGSGRSAALREHAYRAMGPVWEANHVWLIFVLVICWTAYPDAFASIFSTLTVPLFIAALGVILRGTAYAVHAGTAREIERRAIDGVFSISSLLTPFALGTVVGAIASVFGLFAGLGIAKGLYALLAATGLDLPQETLVLAPRTVLVSIGVGTLIALLRPRETDRLYAEAEPPPQGCGGSQWRTGRCSSTPRACAA